MNKRVTIDWTTVTKIVSIALVFVLFVAGVAVSAESETPTASLPDASTNTDTANKIAPPAGSRAGSTADSSAKSSPDADANVLPDPAVTPPDIPTVAIPPIQSAPPSVGPIDVIKAAATNAEQFDKFLRKKLSVSEQKELIDACQQKPLENIFCYSVLNFELFEKKNNDTSGTRKKDRATIVPVIKYKTVVNWLKLRDAPVNVLLRGISRLKPEQVSELRDFSIRQSECPNNVLMAVTASLEDWLPEKISFVDLAALYEKAANCYNDSPDDKENLLVRSGLLYYGAKKITEAEKLFSQASERSDVQPRALYWLYHTQKQNGADEEKLNKTLDRLKTSYPFSFHAIWAQLLAKMDPTEVLKRSDPVFSQRSQAMHNVNVLIEQSEILSRHSFTESAKKVLNWIQTDTDTLEPGVKLYLAELKKDYGDYSGKFTILSDLLQKNPTLVTRKTLELFFPKVFFPTFERNARGVDPYLLAAIARRESAFDPKAVSPARAKGLLQIMPATARRFSKKSNLFDPEQNVEVGARYFSDLLKKHEGQLCLALASYNAGPHRIAEWVKRYSPASDDAILFMDLIPYRETRNYVSSVLRNYYWYRKLHTNDEALTPEQLLKANIKGDITAKNSNSTP